MKPRQCRMGWRGFFARSPRSGRRRQVRAGARTVAARGKHALATQRRHAPSSARSRPLSCAVLYSWYHTEEIAATLRDVRPVLVRMLEDISELTKAPSPRAEGVTAHLVAVICSACTTQGAIASLASARRALTRLAGTWCAASAAEIARLVHSADGMVTILAAIKAFSKNAAVSQRGIETIIALGAAAGVRRARFAATARPNRSFRRCFAQANAACWSPA
jgi:hypothetical protein